MKKVTFLSIVLVFALAFTGCLGISEDSGMGELVVNIADDADITIDADGVDYDGTGDFKVEIDSEEYSLGQVANLRDGKYNIIVLYEAEEDVYAAIYDEVANVTAGKTETVTFDEVELSAAFGAASFEFDPDEYPFDADGEEVDIPEGIDEINAVELRAAAGAESDALPVEMDKQNGTYTADVEEIAFGITYKFVLNPETDEEWITPNDASDFQEDLGGPAGVITLDDLEL